MFESRTLDPVASDEVEIKAYIIRPPVARGSRYHAPRLARSSFKGLKGAGLQPRGFWRVAIVPAALGHQLVGESLGEFRYADSGASALSSGKAWLKRGRFWLLSAALALPFGYLAGALYPVAPVTEVAVPAVLQVASQNLPAKLALLQQKRLAGSLEVGERRMLFRYTVVKGDSFSVLGQRFGLRARSVRLCNDLPRGYRLKVGQVMVIPPTDGVMHRVTAPIALERLARRYEVKPDVLREYNLRLSSQLKTGERVFVPGVRELRYQDDSVGTALRGYRFETRGPWAKRLSVSRSLVGQFGNRVGSLLCPASGQFSSPFGIRGFAFHPGIDICNSVGTTVRAAKSGTVVAAGWMGAYGYAVDIEHGGGVVTRYAHCSSLLVGVGQQVSGAQPIARMGNTGRSTGPHLHFEVRIQGRAVNPGAFL